MDDIWEFWLTVGMTLCCVAMACMVVVEFIAPV
jgi:hypothetical protein